MSKAFTRESDDLPDEPGAFRLPSPLPPGAKNYVTPEGARRLREEFNRLITVERPRLAAAPDAGDGRRELLALEQRIHGLEQSLQTAVVVPPPGAGDDQVRFGATVSVRERDGGERRYRIVGVDESDVDRGWVSWLSPMAKGLLKARRGQRIRLKLPLGEEELEIVDIAYE